MKRNSESILVCSAEIFVLQYWIDKYHRFFKNEFDRFHLILNWGEYWRKNSYLVDYVSQLLPDAQMVDVEESAISNHDDTNISAFGMTSEQRLSRANSYDVPNSKEIIWLTKTSGWHRQGGAMNLVLPFIDAKYLVLWDNDCFCFQSGLISQYLSAMQEQGIHVVGCTGLWVSEDLIKEVAKKNWYGRVNPFFSIFDTDKCFSVDDINFDCRNFYEGEYFPPFQHEVPLGKKYEGDQFTYMCLQLQALPSGVKTAHIGDDKIPDFDIMDNPNHTTGKAPLFHIGNMGGHSYYIAPGNNPDGRSVEDRLQICKLWNEVQNLRTYCWLRAFKDWAIKDAQIKGYDFSQMLTFSDEYERNLQTLRQVAGLKDETIGIFMESQYRHRENTRDLFEVYL